MTAAAVGITSTAPKLLKPARAARKGYFLIGHPNPSTGPLADFGEISPWADDRAIAGINKKGGIYIEEYWKSVSVRLKLIDTGSEPTKAAEVAARLITREKVDLMTVQHTPDLVNPVSAVCDRNHMPCISLDAPVESWLKGAPYKWAYHVFWTVERLGEVFFGTWDRYRDKTNRTVAIMCPNDADGINWANYWNETLPAKGYKCVDPGRFPFFTKDFSAMINQFK